MDVSSVFGVRIRQCVVGLALTCAGGAVLTVGPTTALAQQTRPAKGGLLATGKALFEDQRYEESIQTLSAALLRPGTSKQDRTEIYRYLAYNYITLSQTEEAEAAVRGLYCIDPEFTLGSSESPRFKDFFAQTKKKWEEEGRPGLQTEAAVPKPVTLKHVSPAQWQKDQEIRITGEADDPDGRVSGIEVKYRTGSTGKFSTVAARSSGTRFRAVIPASAVQPPLVEYYIEAQDGAGLPIALRGDASAPLRIAVPSPDQGGSIFGSPWFWAGSAAVVGGVVAAILLAGKSDSGNTQSGPTSHVVVVISP